MIDSATRTLVRNRASDRCEYCALAQATDSYFTFHVEHIIAKQHGGTDELSNLCLSCHHCNLHKGPNVAGIDPDGGELVSLFNPRTQRWDDHFEFQGVWIVGRTGCGRATVHVLAMNTEEQRELRRGPI